VVALVANTAPVAFGALAIPITTLATVSGQPEHTLSQIVGRQTPLLAVFVPMALVFIIDRWRGVRATLPATLTCGLTFAFTQFAVSNYVSTQLTDIIASLAAAASVVLLLRVWRPSDSYVEQPDLATATSARNMSGGTHPGSGDLSAPALIATAANHEGYPVAQGTGTAAQAAVEDINHPDTRTEVFKAYAPYLIIILVFALAQVPPIRDALAATTVKFQWPGLHLQSASGKPSKVPTFTLNWLAAGGTLLILAGLITIPFLGISLAKAFQAYLDTYRQLKFAIITVMAVLALAYVMNSSGQTATLGLWMAGAGAAFAFLSPILGWLGVGVTGSDTSSNSLFGALQVSAATKAGLSPALMAAANSSGGVLGKMISPQNLAIAAAAVGLSGKEGDIFRKVIGWSVGFLVLMCAIVFLQSTPVLSWMLP
jgi:lactate permease